MVADFDLAFLSVGPVTLYWYGAVYTLGFLGIFAWFMMRREWLGLTAKDVFELSNLLALGALVGGRAFDIVVYEAEWYKAHPSAAIDWWQGGMASHGVLLGSLAGLAVFSWWRKVPLMALLDETVVPGAFLMAVGRVGNFIEGGVIGSPSNLPWAVIIPGVEGARHPVALYDSLKNLLLVPVLWAVLRLWPAGKGVSTGLFLLLYAGLRTAIDFMRDYESALFGLPPGQIFNLAMAGAGLVLLIVVAIRPPGSWTPTPARPSPVPLIQVLLFVALLLYPLGIPTSWTRAHIEEMRAAVASGTG
ncbi:prolipoprotein diacylglyceryl transferase [Tabrizicola sp. J26]|uniref:prolipoprotein diacylglyceryl transferase n=1 Tax=Alitabrizicola rongguiensis TaxID=2909234 RepID=UPI001F31F014|nr:prolipoprotein diacylglyceryl transferase [Tabrizicola rongguiensis]MCF1709626.1 prolipoprotein diacylglyceryl transferase [Tabrizicola rongguiensis]